MNQSTFSTIDIHGQIVSVETKDNGNLVLSCGEVRQEYTNYTIDEARGLFSDLLRRKGLI